MILYAHTKKWLLLLTSRSTIPYYRCVLWAHGTSMHSFVCTDLLVDFFCLVGRFCMFVEPANKCSILMSYFTYIIIRKLDNFDIHGIYIL